MEREQSSCRTVARIWEIYEEMQEIVYVLELEAHELVYMNRHAREVYGISSLEDIRGRKCYEILRGSSMPCAVCEDNRLRVGSFLEEVRYNPVLGKKLALKDTLIEDNGKRYRFSMAVDLSAWEQQNNGYEDNEAMVNEGLRLSLAASSPEKSVAVLLEYLGLSLKSERVYIFEETGRKVFDNTYEWCASGVEPQKDNLQGVSYEVVSLWYQKFLKGESVIIKNAEQIREEDPTVYEYLKPQKIQSLVVAPLVEEEKIIGFFGVDNPPERYLEHITTLLQILGHFIAALLHRRDHVRRLEELCFHDQLTGLGNRHAMNEYISGIQPGRSMGVIYCDVMGLKRTNDEKGHLEGDNLLIRASECLRKAFGNQALFRVGGDEFLALCEGITLRELDEGMAMLRQEMKARNALMALGCVWRTDGEADMDQLMKEADCLMYKDKRAQYEKQPEK
ncbi:cyclic di-GMP phosphodiesterase PdeR [Lachnospiraceae bacterium]|nr:cyclic di-GMP phosphodiesterase PdeR [Lachnospiraceae bacterium]